MFRLNNIVAIVLSFSIVMAGVPAYAELLCPMAHGASIQDTAKHPCHGMAKTDSTSKKNGCANHNACITQCGTLALGNSVSSVSTLPEIAAPVSHNGNSIDALHLINSKDRPQNPSSNGVVCPFFELQA